MIQDLTCSVHYYSC
uniref:Uncharacterized protein n=1 Tax=Anguilla anguilla TaxID=7936 RepID=A0A0E9R1U1_ANGAN